MQHYTKLCHCIALLQTSFISWLSYKLYLFTLCTPQRRFVYIALHSYILNHIGEKKKKDYEQNSPPYKYTLFYCIIISTSICLLCISVSHSCNISTSLFLFGDV